MKTPKIITYQAGFGRYGFALVAANGATLMHSASTYARKRDARRATHRVRRALDRVEETRA